MTVSAGSAFVDALREDVDRLLAAEPEVRTDAPDSVHQMRVATRRLRSVLRSYRGLLQPDRSSAVSDELKWLAGVLGIARDAEVRADRFDVLLGKHARPADDEGRGQAAVDAVTMRLVTAERARYRAAHADVLDALGTDRYRELRDTLTGWRDRPPLRGTRAAQPADEFFTVVLYRDRKRLLGLIQAERHVATADRIELLHDIRKSAKRLRYSCEAAAQVLGDTASDLGDRAKRLQTVLGDHRDAVESQHAIYGRAADAAVAGEDTTLYRLLAGAEEAAARQALARYPTAAGSLSDS